MQLILRKEHIVLFSSLYASMERTIISSGVVPFREGEEYLEVLVVNNGDYWGFPKGTIKEGETKMKAALRELEEETSLKPLVISLNPLGNSRYSYQKNDSLTHKTVYFFAGIICSSDKVVLSDEHQAYQWATINKAVNQLSYPHLIAILDSGIVWLESDDYAAEILARNLELLR